MPFKSNKIFALHFLFQLPNVIHVAKKREEMKKNHQKEAFQFEKCQDRSETFKQLISFVSLLNLCGVRMCVCVYFVHLASLARTLFLQIKAKQLDYKLQVSVNLYGLIFNAKIVPSHFQQWLCQRSRHKSHSKLFNMISKDAAR